MVQVEQCHSLPGDCLLQLLDRDNGLQQLLVQSCQSVTTAHRTAAREVIKRENFDITFR